MDGSLFAFGGEMHDTAGAVCFELDCRRMKKMPTSRLGEETGTHRVDGGVRSAVVSRLTTLPIDDPIVLHGVVLGLSCRTLVLCHCVCWRCATLIHC